MVTQRWLVAIGLLVSCLASTTFTQTISSESEIIGPAESIAATDGEFDLADKEKLERN